MPIPSFVAPRRVALRALASVASTCLVAVALTAPATARDSTADRSADASARGGVAASLVASLRGSREVPGPGDPDGRGRVELTLYPSTGKVCATVTWTRSGKPNAAHIHAGRTGVSGDVVIDLTGAVTGGPRCALKQSKGAVRKIIANPRLYYFNVHTKPYPAGAIRGQLHR